jgi:hypothetical protein
VNLRCQDVEAAFDEGSGLGLHLDDIGFTASILEVCSTNFSWVTLAM